MPSINLRLTDEQHQELEQWAHDGRRSIQKEVIWRLFTEPTATARFHERTADSASAEGLATGAESSRGPAGSIRSESGQYRAPSPATDRHFKPDFKK